MKKYLSFFIFLILSFIIFSCKAPMNSFNKSSFPEGSRFSEFTDTIQVAFNNLFNTHENRITIEMNGRYSDHSIDLSLDNDTLTYIGLIKGINEEYSLFLGLSMSGRAKPLSSVILRDRIDKPDTNDIINYSLNKVYYIKPILAGLEVQFDKNGISYSQIMDSLHTWTFKYLSENYTKFYQDTMGLYTKENYSVMFDEWNRNVEGELRFLPISIGYYTLFPEKMDDWSPNRRKNMTFLIEHLFDDLEVLEDLIEEYAENNKDHEFLLCRLLRYFKKPNADDYRIVQTVFRKMPEYRWVDESLLK